jgi:hypothetical protein
MNEHLTAMGKRHPTEIVVAIYKELVAIGWTHTPGVLADFCTKEFETAVGFKTASAVADVRADGAVSLRGEYDSEARNVLERLDARLLSDATDDDIQSLVQKFAEEVDDLIADTYAARLMHHPTCEQG